MLQNQYIHIFISHCVFVLVLLTHIFVRLSLLHVVSGKHYDFNKRSLFLLTQNVEGGNSSKGWMVSSW